MGQVMVPLKGELPKVADVVIVGGGIVGVSTAFFCSRGGLKTVVVESGRRLAQLIVGKTSDSDNPFSFERFLRPRAMLERAMLEPKERIL